MSEQNRPSLGSQFAQRFREARRHAGPGSARGSSRTASTGGTSSEWIGRRAD